MNVEAICTGVNYDAMSGRYIFNLAVLMVDAAGNAITPSPSAPAVTLYSPTPDLAAGVTYTVTITEKAAAKPPKPKAAGA